jgi:hypothetical protein
MKHHSDSDHTLHQALYSGLIRLHVLYHACEEAIAMADAHYPRIRAALEMGQKRLVRA